MTSAHRSPHAADAIGSERATLAHRRRSRLLPPIVALILTLSAITAVWLLVDRADNGRASELHIASMSLSLSRLKLDPFGADTAAGGSATTARAAIVADEAPLSAGLTMGSQAGVPPSLIARGRASLAEIEPVVQRIYRVAIAKGGLAAGGRLVPQLQKELNARSAVLVAVLSELTRDHAASASRAETQVKLGAAVAMLLLLIAFAYFYVRSVAAHEAVERLASENEVLLGVSVLEARTDALTDLGNRRALAGDLARAIPRPPGAEELLLAMFDLDGFKEYNDSFGHAAGDALLQRLSSRLNVAMEPVGSAYRLGGDEFCVFARCTTDDAQPLLDAASLALHETGDSWDISCSRGAVWIPSEAATESQALSLADERMYAHKASRSSASRQVTDALVQVIAEQDAGLDAHMERVAELAGSVAEELGQSQYEQWQVRRAATLHDVGKTAIPSAILDKPGPLDESEWTYMRRHTIIGERIVLAAPALSATAPLIRSSHERVDGQGYPDGLAGEDIPLGARIIAVCDAYDAMTSRRAYRGPMSVAAALRELERKAGTQFDASVVTAFCRAVSLHQAADEAPAVAAAV